MNRFCVLFSLCLLLLSLPFLSTAQDAAEFDPLENIRDKYSQIVSAKTAKTLTITEVSYGCPKNPEQGTIRYYESEGKLRLIEHSYNMGDHFGAGHEYYVWDDELFFHFSDEGTWMFDTADGAGDTSPMQTVDDVTERRHYYYKGNPIRCLEKSYQVRSRRAINPSSDEIPNTETECYSEAPEHFQILLEIKTSREMDCEGYH